MEDQNKNYMFVVIGMILVIAAFILYINKISHDLAIEDAEKFSVDSVAQASRDSADRIAKAERLMKIEKALAAFRKEHDEMSGMNWYYDKTTTRHYNENSIHAYIGQDGDKNYFLRFSFQYTGEDWLFIESLSFKCDSTVYNYRYGADKTDVLSGGNVAEWFDVSAMSEGQLILRAIAGAKSVKVRQNGREFYKDRVLSAKEIAAIKNIMTAWDLVSPMK